MEFVKLSLATYEAVQLTPCPIPCTMRIKSVYTSGSEEATVELCLWETQNQSRDSFRCKFWDCLCRLNFLTSADNYAKLACVPR